MQSIYRIKVGSIKCPTERAARREAARLLGVANLRGLAQAPTERGFYIYAPGADDFQGACVEIYW